MIKLENSVDCSGCTACVHICPQQCISFNPDSEGFYYPLVDTDKCTDCGLCDRVCPVLHWRKQPKEATPAVYAATIGDKEILLNSASGGAFSVFANWVITEGGVVFGAIYDQQFKVVHGKAETTAELSKLRGSKYVQSDLGTIYLEIKKLLKEGRNVLFTGVPCQVAGLKLYLRKDYQHLYCADLICHGVPSPKVFADYINFVQRKKKLSGINMRWKGLWKNSSCKLFYKDGTSVVDMTWRNLYAKGVMDRPSCHQCEFTHFNRVGDITIADYWGIEKVHPEFFNEKGVSLMLINTLKGKQLFDVVKQHLLIQSSSCSKCIQPRLIDPPQPSPSRNQFWEDYERMDFERIIRKYAGYGWTNRMITIPKRIVYKLLKALRIR